MFLALPIMFRRKITIRCLLLYYFLPFNNYPPLPKPQLIFPFSTSADKFLHKHKSVTFKTLNIK